MSKETILIVEDEAITGMGLKKSLTDLGYSVIGIVPTGEQAVEVAIEKKPNLVLMDIQLAGKMDGIVAAENIRVRARIPVIFLTAYSDDRFVQKAKITEPFGYILKPVREQELRTTIEMAFYKHAMEQELRLSEETTRVLLNETADMHFLIDNDGKILVVNEALAIKAGIPLDKLVGTQIYDLVSSGILSSKMVAWNLTQNQTQSLQFEEEFKGRWFNISVHPICNPVGTIVKHAVHIRDITKTKKIEEQLLQNEEFFRTLLEDSADIIVILNSDGTFRHESRSLNRVTGYSQAQVAGKSLFDILQKDDVSKAKQIFETILQNPYMVKPFRIVIKNNDKKMVAIDGIISNLSDNPVIEGIVFCGWVVLK